MTLLALVDYGFIVAFFVVLAVLVLLMTEPHQQEDTASNAIRSVQRNAAAYSFLAALFVLFIVLTLFARRNHSALH